MTTKNMIKATEHLTYISLFSCAGIGCYGFQQAGFECIATNELIEKRLQIQKYNHKCYRAEGYINGDLSLHDTKVRIYSEITWWKKNRNINDVDVVIATPPCQGMSIFNHKKNENDIQRNSLVIESIELVKNIKPKMFLFENVPAFMNTLCYLKDNSRVAIKHAIREYLFQDYIYYYDTINFKNYGSNSSRNRTLVIGVRRDIAKFVSPIEFFPFYSKEKTLRDVIGHLHSLREMGEIDASDIFHFFRAYPNYMREWIQDIGEGESAFDNIDFEKRPYKLGQNGEHIPNVNKTGDKYTRQEWNKVAPSIHTRNDQLASQNTIHPDDDRVFSIRELMLMMSIPMEFRWTSDSLDKLNSLTIEDKKAYLKKEEANIRQCIGEAVPTAVFKNIAELMASYLKTIQLSDSQITRIIIDNNLNNPANLATYIKNNFRAKRDALDITTLSRIAELANNQRIENAAYYTEKETLTEIFQKLPLIEKEIISVLEPSVGTGNFIPFIIKKYSYAKQLYIDVVDIDKSAISVLREIKKHIVVPQNVKITIRQADFLKLNVKKRYDLIIGNPPFINLKESNNLKIYQKLYDDKDAKNIASFFLYKAIQIADNIAFILPKNFLCNRDYNICRQRISNLKIRSIIDFGHRGFGGVRIETILLCFNTQKRGGKVDVASIVRHIELQQMQKYITDPSLPTWVIYRNRFFDTILKNKKFDAFEVFRDRQITKTVMVNGDNIWVVKAKNIRRDGSSIDHIDGYDAYISKKELEALHVSKFLNDTSVYLVPNMTYYPRMIQKPKGVVTNGSVAILSPKPNINVTKDDLKYIASKEFEEFYRIARNYANRSLNIDMNTIFYFCVERFENLDDNYSK